MANSVPDLKAQLVDFQYNPAGIQRAVMQLLTDASNGNLQVVDPTNPFVFCLEAASVLTAVAMAKTETCTRKMYPAAAQTMEDLYPHMSDRDYIGRFATPSKTIFSMLLDKNEILNKMVLDPATGIKKIIIPRNTFFTVAGVVFSLQYPIEIRQPAHGGIQIVYDASVASPLQELSSNVIDWEIRTNAGVEYLYFDFEVAQFNILTQSGSLNAATDFKVDIPFEDQYYFTRVYVKATNGKWQEIATTHTDQIYDIAKPTAVLKVTDKTLTVRIPQIYTSTSLLNSSIRIDVYQTKGELALVLSNYPAASFIASWLGIDSADNNVFTAPMNTLQHVMVFSNGVVTGGSGAVAFETLREQVIMNATGAPKQPITNIQLANALQLEGYDVVKNIDNITNRIFLATRAMPNPTDETLITAAAASIETLSVSLDQIVQLNSVIDNGNSVTITPETLYQMTNGLVSLVPSEKVAQLLALPVDQRALAIEPGLYTYTPFHYVLDATNGEFAVRPYYLDAPQVLTKTFVSENDTTLMQAGTQSYAIVRTTTGYKLQLTTLSSATFKELDDSEIFVQLAFIPQGEKDLAYLMGSMVSKTSDGERTYEFDLSTTFNVDAKNNLELTKFFLYTTEPRITKAPLQVDFDVLWSTSAPMGTQWVADSVDRELGLFLLPIGVTGITNEKLRVKFGDALDTLWARSRSVISSTQYKKWAVDVPRLYEEDIYQADASGSTITIDGNGNVSYNILHHKGDPVLDNDGNPVYQFRVGDVMVDVDGNPEVLNERGILRQIDIFLIEGVYRFATDQTAINYRAAMTATVVNWLTNDLEALSEQLLEQTHLYFYPKTTQGLIDVMVLDGLKTSISAGQSFKVVLYVNSTVYTNEDLRKQLELATIKTISDALTNATVSNTAIQTALKDQYGTDVISVDVSGFGLDGSLSMLTVLDDGNRCNIQKRLIAQPDNTLIVQEDVTVDFVRHETRS